MCVSVPEGAGPTAVSLACNLRMLLYGRHSSLSPACMAATRCCNQASVISIGLQEAKDLRWMAAATDRLPPDAPVFADKAKQAEVDAKHSNGKVSNGKAASNGKAHTTGDLAETKEKAVAG